ncbi:MAG: 23S rRNA (uracil(1939)-C(5))-methyltransferase RlmD, partial [Candidatus Woesearchaeota archaeon]
MEVKPLCLYFGDCGGCSAQHISYEVQLENKKNLVINELRNNNIELSENIQIFYSEPYFYRNRMDFVFFDEGIGLR